MKGKEKCKALKEIRKKIAEENDILYAVEECSHKGDCKGTCPKCEAELRYLERELDKKRKLGEKVAIAGISMGAMTALAGCNPVDDLIVSPIRNVTYTVGTALGLIEEPLAGETVEYIPPEVEGEPTYIEPVYIDPGEDYEGGETYDPGYNVDDGELAGDVAYDPNYDPDACSDPDILDGEATPEDLNITDPHLIN